MAGIVKIDPGKDAPTPRRVSANFVGKLATSRVRALEALCRALFEGDGDGAQFSADRDSRGGHRDIPAVRGEHVRRCSARQSSLEEQLRSRSAAFIREERRKLHHQLHAELKLKRKRFVARKGAMSEEAFRAAKREQTCALQKQEHDLRLLLARRERKDLKKAVYGQLSLGHAQQKDQTLLRLRKSLGRGTVHNVGGLRGELWDAAQDKRTRTLQEGEAAFEHSCRLLRRQWEESLQVKLAAMKEESVAVEANALTVLQEGEAQATEDDLRNVWNELAKERADAESTLKNQLKEEAARVVNLAVDNCTSTHKKAQEKAAMRAFEALRQALESTAKHEEARTTAVLERERQRSEHRMVSFASAVHKALLDCSLRTCAGGSGMPPTTLPFASPAAGVTEMPHGGDGGRSAITANVTRAMGVTRYLEHVATAAEGAYASRARNLVRLRATAALKERRVGVCGLTEIGSPSEAYTMEAEAEVLSAHGRGREGRGNILSCQSCTTLYDANEGLLQEARSRGLLS